MNKTGYLVTLCLISTLGGFLFGFDTAVISGTLTFVRSQFAMSALLEGWFVGSALLGCILGVSFAGILADRFGRKWTQILAAILLLVSAAGCMLSRGLTELILFRLVGGLGVGVVSILAPLYISEISLPHFRGRMVSLYQFAITIGILAAYWANARILELGQGMEPNGGGLLTWVLHSEVWRGMFGSEAIPGLLYLILLLFIPESPRWLLARGWDWQARTVLERVMPLEAVEAELREVAGSLKQVEASWRQLLVPGLRYALFIGVSLALLSQFSGINAIIYYGPTIFESAGFEVGGALSGQVVIGIVNVLFTLVAIWKIDSLGRRKLLLFGCCGMFLAHLVIGLLFYTGHSQGLLLLVFLAFFIAFFAFSYGPVIWTLIAEIYPTQVRGRAMSIATLALWTGTFVIGQTVPWLLETIKPHGTFWLFSLMILPAVYITWRLVPETQGRSLEEIERHWLDSERGK